MEMREITANIKKALLEAGYNNNLSVTRGKGTACMWVHVKMDVPRHENCSCGEPDEYGRRETCDKCKDKFRAVYNTVNQVATLASGRGGLPYENQNILVNIGWAN